MGLKGTHSLICEKTFCTYSSSPEARSTKSSKLRIYLIRERVASILLCVNLLWLFVPRESLRPCRSCDTSILASNLSGKKEMLLGLHTLLIHLDTLGKLHRVEVHSNAREMQLICYKNSNRNNANPSSTKRNSSKHRNETGDSKQQHGSEGR